MGAARRSRGEKHLPKFREQSRDQKRLRGARTLEVNVKDGYELARQRFLV